MGCIHVPTVEDAYGLVVFRLEASKELDEASLIINLEIRSRSHVVVREE